MQQHGKADDIVILNHPKSKTIFVVHNNMPQYSVSHLLYYRFIINLQSA